MTRVEIVDHLEHYVESFRDRRAAACCRVFGLQ
jgi:hypothetical protein